MGIKVNVGKALVRGDRNAVKGSVDDIAKANNTSIADVFSKGVKCVVLVDVSSSMSAGDSRDRRSRYSVAVSELEGLQASLPGNIAVFSFSNDARFEPTGVPMPPSGSTNLSEALRYTSPLDKIPAVERFIVISDGQPDSEADALHVASQFSKPIDGIYVGPEGYSRAIDFMRRLSEKTGGKAITSDTVKGLSDNIQLLLNGGETKNDYQDL